MSISRFISKIKYILATIVLFCAIGTQLFFNKKDSSNFPVVTTPVYTPNETLLGYLPTDDYDRPSQILYRKSYVVSYNKEIKCPNWVFWELTSAHADGDIKRPDYAFHEDLDVPAPRAELGDYKHSGYDRGHMCPAGDNKWDNDAMYESFLMTNMCPQNQNLNSGLWNQIEIQCRQWAKKYGRIFIVCGPIFMNREHKTIGANHVFVPEAFFKVVVCLDDNPKGIGFICRNTDGNRKKDYYVNTVSQVERATGYSFFPGIDQETAEIIKEYADLKEW